MKEELVARLEPLNRSELQRISLARFEFEIQHYSVDLAAAKEELSTLNGDPVDQARAVKLETDCEFFELAFKFFEGKREIIVREIRMEAKKT